MQVVVKVRSHVGQNRHGRGREACGRGHGEHVHMHPKRRPHPHCRLFCGLPPTVRAVQMPIVHLRVVEQPWRMATPKGTAPAAAGCR